MERRAARSQMFKSGEELEAAAIEKRQELEARGLSGYPAQRIEPAQRLPDLDPGTLGNDKPALATNT